MTDKRLSACLMAAVLSAGAAVTVPPPAAAADGSSWIVRGRVIGVMPTGKSGGISPDLAMAGVEAESAVVPELDITFMATPNFGIEVILATTPHDISGTGAIAGLGKVGDAWMLPPTILAQYHFAGLGKVRPYLGAGINYTMTYGEDASSALSAALGGPTRLRLNNSFGWAVQAGVDYDLGGGWLLNADVKYIDLGVDATITTGGIRREAEVAIDPVVVGIGIGYRF